MNDCKPAVQEGAKRSRAEIDVRYDEPYPRLVRASKRDV
jgi:hypothetical protein